MRFYRWLLRVCSPWFADEYGVAMEETFARRLADAAHIGRWRVAWLWQREVMGLVALGFKKAGRMDVITQELRYAVRRLCKSPAFTAAAVLTLALAIGANAAIFTVVHRVVLNPLPYADADRLIQIDHGSLRLNAREGMGLTPGLYFHYAARSQTLDRVAIYRTEDLTLTGGGPPERLRVARVTPSLAAVLGVAPRLGRWFVDEDGRPGAARVVVLSQPLWQRRYGGDPRVVGTAVTLAGQPATIAGVMPASFRFPEPQTEMWVAEQLTPAAGFGLWSYTGVARLRTGRTFEDVRADLNALVVDVASAYPDDPRAAGNAMAKIFFAGKSLKDATLGSIERGLWILLASVGLVLLVACANVANLFLVRSDARQRDVAVRRALGAGGGRIARYFYSESLALSAAGGALGLAIAWIAVRLVVGFAPANLPRLHEIEIDFIVIGYTALVSAAAAILFGSIPLTHRGALALSLHDSGRGSTVSVRRYRARHALMGAQVAVALVLLVGAALMVRSVQALRALDPGFNPISTLTFGLGLSEHRYRTRDEAVAAHHGAPGDRCGGCAAPRPDWDLRRDVLCREPTHRRDRCPARARRRAGHCRGCDPPTGSARRGCWDRGRYGGGVGQWHPDRVIAVWRQSARSCDSGSDRAGALCGLADGVLASRASCRTAEPDRRASHGLTFRLQLSALSSQPKAESRKPKAES